MIRLSCPACNSNLNAKDMLAGQTRKCPKCGTPVRIPAAKVESALQAADPILQEARQGDDDPGLPVRHGPDRLNRKSRYLIISNSGLVACWENNGQGWMLKTTSGLLSAKHNRELIPNQGQFELVELKFAESDADVRLEAIRVYRLSPRWALNGLGTGDHEVLKKVVGPGCLNKQQKDLVRQTLRDQLMRTLWTDAKEVLEYLANTDYHSSGTE